MRWSFRPGTATTVGTYARTIKSFSFAPDFKRRRHALRLAANLRDLLEHGRFDLRLQPGQARRLSDWAGLPDEAYLSHLDVLSPVAIR